MRQQESMHMVCGRTEGGQISSQAVENRSLKKKIAVEQEQSITLSDEKKCFACNETSHSLDQCRIKYNLVSVAQLFGHATRFPFYTIQPSEDTVEKEKFYHHCLLITSTISNLDPAKVKDELHKSWKLSSSWEFRRECKKNFIASFNSEDDLISCLKHSMMETYLDDKEVKFTVTRWTEGNAESIDLNRQWFSVCGVPRIYRNWKELYQVASAFGVLIGVDEESLEAGDTKPIRLKIASIKLDGAPFSHHFVFGWSCRMVTFTVEDKGKDINQQKKELGEQNATAHLDALNKESEEKRNKVIEMPTETLNKETSKTNSSSTGTVASTSNHVLDFGDCSDKKHRKELITSQKGILLEGPKCNEESRFDGEIKESKISAPATNTINSNKTEVDSLKTEGVQSIRRSSTSLIGQEHFRGIPKPPIIHVFTRRPKKQQVNEASNKSPSNKQDKGLDLGNRNHAKRTGASTGCNSLNYNSCPQKEHKGLNLEKTAPEGESPKSEEIGAYRENKDKNRAPAAAKIDSKKKQTSEDSSKTESAQFIGGCIKGFGMDGMAPGVEFHEEQYASKVAIRLAQYSKEVTTDSDIHDSFSKMGLLENLLKGIYQYGLEKPSAVHQRGIVSLCKGFDVIQQSLSGTTVTICCGVLQRLDYGSAECQALVVVPTRDIAQETEKIIQSIGQCLGVKAHACAGGYSVHAEKQILSNGVQVLIGTPGRVLDVLQRRALRPDHIGMVVLDEADELLTGGSKGQIYNIMQFLPKKLQVGVFSATFSNKALEFSHKFMDKPVTIIVPRDEELKGINMEQFHVKVDMEELKLGQLCDIFDKMVVTQSIIFVTTRHRIKSLKEEIRGKGITVATSHGGMNQHARDTAIQEFRSGSCRILIATDLRQTDAVHAPVVINYDLPTHPVHYRRRILQNGLPERKGVAINFVTCADERKLSVIQRFCNSQIGELPSNIADLPIGYGVQKKN